MICPVCKIRAGIKETRMQDDGSMMRRYRCANDHKFVTHEALDRVYTDADVKAYQREAGLRLFEASGKVRKPKKAAKPAPLQHHVAQAPARPPYRTMEMLSC